MPELVSSQKCCMQLIFGGPQATEANARIVVRNLRDLDPLADPHFHFDTDASGRRRVVVQDCEGELGNIDSLVSIDDASRDHPTRKIFEPLKRSVGSLGINLSPRFRCGCDSLFRKGR